MPAWLCCVFTSQCEDEAYIQCQVLLSQKRNPKNRESRRSNNMNPVTSFITMAVAHLPPVKYWSTWTHHGVSHTNSTLQQKKIKKMCSFVQKQLKENAYSLFWGQELSTSRRTLLLQWKMEKYVFNSSCIQKCVCGRWGWYLFVHICALIQSPGQTFHFDLIPEEITAIKMYFFPDHDNQP